MSAFLGPIHYAMYHKMKLQEELTQDIFKTAGRQGWNIISEDDLNASCGEAELRPLEDIIDLGNIHGWLQQKITVIETRFAVLVTSLLKEDPSRLSELEETAYRFGQKHPVERGTDAVSAFQTIDSNLLDGMPCDRVKRIVDQDTDKIVWQQTLCVHHGYWEQAGGDVAVFYALRKRSIEGMLAGSGFRFHIGEDGLFEIRKE